MIIDAFVNLGIGLIQPLLGLLPEIETVPQISTAVDWIANGLGAMNILLPGLPDTLVTILTLALAFETVIIGFKVFDWFLKKIPFIG
jgi:hypothetical protein